MPAKKLSIDEILSKRQDQISPKDGKTLVKAFTSPPSWNAANRTGRFVMSTEAPDRYKDVVVTDGANIDNFMQNPVALLFHARDEFPVGTWSNLEKMTPRRPPRLEADLNLIPAQTTDE